MGFLLLSGSAIALPTHAHAPSAPVPAGYSVTLTAYNAVPAQTDASPFETASGAYSNPAVVAARSRNLASELPFGTIIEIDGSNISSQGTCGYSVVAQRIGYRVIADTMPARYTDRIDILFDTQANYRTADHGMQNAAGVLGICNNATTRVVGYVNINRIPATQAELAALVRSGNSLALK